MSKKLTVREVASELYRSNYGPYLIYGAAIAIRGLAKTYGKTESEVIDDLEEENKRLEEENKNLKEFKTKREESMFYFKALAERAEPINSKEAEELQKYKKLFEKLYREELYYLEEENKNLNEKVRFLEECLDNKEKVNKKLREELSAYDREYFDEDKKAKNIFIDKSGKVIKGGEFTTLC